MHAGASQRPHHESAYHLHALPFVIARDGPTGAISPFKILYSSPSIDRCFLIKLP